MKTTNQLAQDVLKLVELSAMEDDEKRMWLIMIPNMNEEELTKLKKILEKEVNKLTDIYLKLLKSKNALK